MKYGIALSRLHPAFHLEATLEAERLGFESVWMAEHLGYREAILSAMACAAATERAKVRCIHLNHTNPALGPGAARQRVEAAGMRGAEEGETVAL